MVVSNSKAKKFNEKLAYLDSEWHNNSNSNNNKQQQQAASIVVPLRASNVAPVLSWAPSLAGYISVDNGRRLLWACIK